ncbi:zinc-dependent metalloprotease [Methanosarcina sp. T3]|uniref:zinc-dependent metalloprotease n=1 Tax=Methanosarcina sp. T3 TaxID=3439062 RepID=UPI003F838EF3
MSKNKIEISVLLLVILLVSTAFVLAGSAAEAQQNSTEKEKEDIIFISDPWFEKGDELNRLSGDELRALAEQNETVRKMIEEDLKIEPVQIESLKDLENLPKNYPEDIKKAVIENFTSRNISQQPSTKATTTINTVNVWVVADEEYWSTFGSNWPTQAYNTIENADNAFYSDHNIDFVIGKYSTWDSDDSTSNCTLLLQEVQSETGWNSDHQGMDMLAVFSNQGMDNRGMSERRGDAWIMKHQITSGWDWHLAQHEASHNYDCPDHDYLGPECIMTYTFMMSLDNWCSSCDSVIETNRNHF